MAHCWSPDWQVKSPFEKGEFRGISSSYKNSPCPPLMREGWGGGEIAGHYATYLSRPTRGGGLLRLSRQRPPILPSVYCMLSPLIMICRLIYRGRPKRPALDEGGHTGPPLRVSHPRQPVCSLEPSPSPHFFLPLALAGFLGAALAWTGAGAGVRGVNRLTVSRPIKKPPRWAIQATAPPFLRP